MTVPSTYTPDVSTANGVTTVFPYSFRILDAEHLVIMLDGVALTYPTDYSVSGVGNPSGGNATLLVAPASGVQVIRSRATPIARATDYQNLGDLLATTLDDDQDAPILMIQELKEAAGRTLTLALGSGASSELPLPEASKLLQWTPAADGLRNVAVSELITSIVIAGNYIVDEFAGTGAQTDFTLSADPGVKNNTQVYVDGVYIEKADYSVTGTTLAFGVAPANLALIEVVQAGAVPINTPADGSVGFYAINAAGSGAFLRRTGTGLAWSNEFNQSLAGTVGARIDFKADVTTPIANGVSLPTSTTFNSAANFHNDALTGSDGTGSWQTDPTAFAWWQKSGSALYRNMRLIVGSSAGMAVLELDGALTATGRATVASLAETRQTVAAAASTTLNLALGMVIVLTQDTNITTLAFSNVPAAGLAATLTIKRVKDATGTARAITWPASVKWPGGVAPTLSSTSGAIDIITLLTEDGGTTWFGSYGLAYA